MNFFGKGHFKTMIPLKNSWNAYRKFHKASIFKTDKFCRQPALRKTTFWCLAQNSSHDRLRRAGLSLTREELW